MLKLRTLLLSNKIFVVILLLSLTYSFLFIKYDSKNSIYDINQKEFYLVIDSYKISNSKIIFNLKGKENIVGNFYIKGKYLPFNIGDKLKIKGSLLLPSNNTIPNTFNYKKHLNNKGIFYILRIESYEIFNKNKNIFYKIKNNFYKRVEKYDNKGYLYAFILGEKNYIDSEIYKTYSNNGVTHLFALSGLHVSTFSIIVFCLLKIFKINDFFRYIITFIILILLCFITGFSPSIVRASLLFFLIGINKIYYFYVKSENILILLFSIFLFFNPYYVYNLSFQLSFTITYFILLNSGKLNNNYILSMLKVSLISFLASLPIIINNFYSINLLSILNNLFFIPYITFIIYPLSLITFIFPLLYNFYSFLICIMEKISVLISNIKIFSINISQMKMYLIIIYYFNLFLYYKKFNKKNLYFVIILILFIKFSIYFDKTSYVYFIDVGQGDSCLILTKNKKSILIDTGGNTSFYDKEYSLMNNSVIPFFKSIGLSSIDYLFLTHGDEDHIGYVNDLTKKFKVKNIFGNTGDMNELEKNIDNFRILDKEYLKIDNIEIYSLNNKIFDNENDNSLILLIIIDNYKFLFMGDASKKVEENIIKDYNLKNIDVLKIGHHGSKTSSSEQFIKKVKPNYSIISVKKENKFNHPNEETIIVLNKYDSKIYYTSLDGTCLFKVINNSLYINNYAP